MLIVNINVTSDLFLFSKLFKAVIRMYCKKFKITTITYSNIIYLLKRSNMFTLQLFTRLGVCSVYKRRALASEFQGKTRIRKERFENKVIHVSIEKSRDSVRL